MRRIYRDGLLVLTTAIACFAVATPLASSTSRQTPGEYTVLPGQGARFAKMDWSCDYFADDAKNAIPATVNCGERRAQWDINVFINRRNFTVIRMSRTEAKTPLEVARKS